MPIQRQDGDVDSADNRAVSFVALLRLLPKLLPSLSQRQDGDVDREVNLVAKPREMLLPWPMLPISFSALSKSTIFR
jgi:hypothetical protein